MKPPLIVAGMHRSGTSFVSSLLVAAGIDMGERLMPAARGNERGHFENMDFVEFHMRWLRLTGYDDSGWAAAQTVTLPEEAASEARDIIAANARSSGWGWKDPRTTLFLEFWANVVPDAHYAIIYREPSEVVDSLFRRMDVAISLTPALAAAAYVAHNEMILRFARANRDRCIIASASAVAKDPERFLTLVAQKFNMDLNAQAPSPFEAGLTREIERDSPRPTLLRYVVPEIGPVYAGLEHDADMPSGSHLGTQISAKAKDAFFDEWLLTAERLADMRVQHEVDQNGDLPLETALLVGRERRFAQNNRDAQVLLDASQTRIRELSIELENMTSRNARAAESLRHQREAADRAKHLEAELGNANARIGHAEFLLREMRSSIFWRIRNSWFRFKRLFGVTTDVH